MSLNVPKIRIIQDVEDRIIDEVQMLDKIKGQLIQLLHTNSSNTREVRFSELIYDESNALLISTIEAHKADPRYVDYQNQVRRIYKFRVGSSAKDHLYEASESPWIIHSDVVGNILERASYNKDLLQPFFNKALPKHLRRNVWRALLTYPEAEEEYINLFKEARWKTLSLNEVEITKKSVELLSEHCHQLAFNEKIVTAMKVVLSYIEKIMQRRLPEYMFYIVMPIMYTLTELSASLPRLVGICLRMAEIQTTVWSSSKDSSIIEVFFKILSAVSKSMENKIKSLIDLSFQENQTRFENFLRMFISRLGSGFFNIETTCVVFDQLVMINTLNKMYYILCLVLEFLRQKLEICTHWDDFLAVFFKEIRRISPMQLESLLEALKENEDLEDKVQIPEDKKGQEYLDYVIQAQQYEEEQRLNKVHELGELLSTKRLLADDPVLGVHQQKILKRNLMELALNKTNQTIQRRSNKKGTLINANLTRISIASKKSRQFSPKRISIKDSREIINLSGSQDMFVEENSFPNRTNSKKPNVSKSSIFQDTSLDQNRFNKINERKDTISLIKQPLGVSDSIDSPFDNLSIKKTLENESKVIANESKLVKDEPKLNLSRLSIKPESKNNSILIEKVSASDRVEKKEQFDDSIQEIPDISFLEGGLLGVPNIDSLKTGLLDGFED